MATPCPHAAARRLASEGATVVIGYQSSAIAAEALVVEIEARGGKAIALKADAADACRSRAARTC